MVLSFTPRVREQGVTECVNVPELVRGDQGDSGETRGKRRAFWKAASNGKQEAVQKANCALFLSIKRSASVIFLLDTVEKI